MSLVTNGREVLTVKEVARVLGVAPVTVYRNASSLGAVRLTPRRIAFPRARIEALLGAKLPDAA